MKIFIPFSIRDIGGTTTFVQNFSAALKKQGYDILKKPSLDFSVLFIVADCSLWYPFLAKILGKRIIQRLDGVYHPATPFGRWYWIYNIKMQIIHNYLADTVIYQSQFSRDCCERFLGRTRAKKTCIIYNGVDLDAIPVKQDFSSHFPIKLLTFAKFRRRDQIEPLLESVKCLNPQKYTFEIFGSYTENLRHLFKDLPSNIVFHGKKPHSDLLGILHQYDIFLFSDQSACPNSVLEAMAAGLPVIAYDRGSINELVQNTVSGEVALLPTHNPFHEQYPFQKVSYQEMTAKVLKVANNLKNYKQAARRRTIENYDLHNMLTHYLHVIL